MNWIVILLKREFRLFFSNKLVMAIFIGAPVLYGVLTAYVYIKGEPKEISIIVVDEDASPLSENIREALHDNEYVDIFQIKSNQYGVEDAVKLHDIAAVITIPDHFESDIYSKKHPEIIVDINTSNIVSANYASRGIQHVLASYNAGIEIEALQKGGMPARQAQQHFEAFQVSYARHYNQTANYMVFLWPGILGTIIQQVFLLALALTFAREFEEQTFGIMLNYTKSAFGIILIKTVPFAILGLGLWVGMGLMFPLFGVPLQGSFLLLNLSGAVFILAIIAIGICVSVFVPNQLKATEVLMIIATPSFIISGFTWPLAQMPTWVQHIAYCIPLTHFLEAFRKITLYQAGLTHILPQMQRLLFLMFTFYFLSLAGIYWKIRQFRKPLMCDAAKRK
ncbi:MAG: ABC transporter permease [Cyclobacteriaceae bacterium]|nr:ABC transporter permease [Cyclobacteriaceae bacterium]